MNIFLNLGKRLLTPSLTNQFHVSVRCFNSATTGETFSFSRDISPFLKVPTKVCTLPYYVRRTKFLSLPIYSEFKNGRTRHLTIIRRIQGNVSALKQDLSRSFPDWHISINPLTQHLVIKGLKVHQMRDWLTAKGF